MWDGDVVAGVVDGRLGSGGGGVRSGRPNACCVVITMVVESVGVGVVAGIGMWCWGRCCCCGTLAMNLDGA